MIRKLLPALMYCWLASTAMAATLAGVTLPDTYTVDGKSLVLNGIGVRTLTIINVRAYVAGLYLPQPSHDARQIFASPGPKVTAKGVRVLANDRVIGDFANKDLAYRLLAGFIGDHPPSQELRRQLLGLPED